MEPVRPMIQPTVNQTVQHGSRFSFKSPQGTKESVPVITDYYPSRIVYPLAKVDRRIDNRLVQAATLAQERAHVAIEVDDVEKAVAFYKDVFKLEQMSGGEGDAFFKLGDHQFLAIFEVDKVQRANMPLWPAELPRCRMRIAPRGRSSSS